MKSDKIFANGREKCAIRDGWLTPIPRERRKSALRVLGKHFRDYCENSSLPGYGHLTETSRPWLERIICIAFHAAALCMLGLIVGSAYTEYRERSVITVTDTISYPSVSLEFPGISICNVNRISRKAAIELASEIASSNVTNREFDDIFQLLRHLGSLYESLVEPNVTGENDLHQLLVEYYKGDYDVTKILKRLSPNCTDGFSSCRFHGKYWNCSELFVFRRVQHGYCCTFNDIRTPDDASYNDSLTKEYLLKPYHIDFIGSRDGLSLVMEPFANDYYYPMFPIIGWTLMISKPHEYPDNRGGSTFEILISRATMTIIQMEVSSIYSDDPVRGIELKKRQCIFQDEFKGKKRIYTESDCHVDCRADSLWKRCGCRTFSLPRRSDVNRRRKICDLRNLECLRTGEENEPTSSSDNVDNHEETEEEYISRKKKTRSCIHCIANCDEVSYRQQIYKSKLKRGYYQNELLENVQLENQSIVNVYFSKQGSIRRKQVVAYEWYELISDIGGIGGIFIGLSLMSVVEFFYFFFRLLGDLSRDEKESTRMKITNARVRKIIESSGEMTNYERHHVGGKLYWNEFFPLPASVTKFDLNHIQSWNLRK